MRQRTFDQVSVAIRDGAGPPLVIMSGVMSDASTFQPLVDAITLPNPVAVVTRRGRRPSGEFGDGFSLRTEIDDLHGVLDGMGGPVELFGWSYGGLIAIEAALERADVRSLTLYEPVSAPFAPHTLPELRECAARGDLDRALEIVNVDITGFSAEHVAALRENPQWSAMRELARPLAEELDALESYAPRYERYRDLDLPLMLLAGELNEGVAPYGSSFARFAAAAPQARVVRIAGQGHFAHANAPQVLAGFLTEAVQPRPVQR